MSDFDISPLRGSAAANAATDLQRRADTQHGLAARPEVAMQAKWAAPLREQPWMARVVVEVAWFVRRDDLCTEDLPYAKIADVAGIPLDAGRSPEERAAQIRTRIWAVLDLLADIRPEWYDANIASQLARRAAETSQVPLDDLDPDTAPSGRVRGVRTRRTDFSEPPVYRRIDLHVSLEVATRNQSEKTHSLRLAAPGAHDQWTIDVTAVAARAAHLLAADGSATQLALTLDEIEHTYEIPAIRTAAGLIAPQRLEDPQLAAEFLQAATMLLLEAAEVI